MKRKIIIDIDDTIFKSHELIIDRINDMTGKHYTTDNIVDFTFSNFSSVISQKELLNMFEDDYFFDNVEIYEGFEDFINKFSNVFSFVLLSKGTERNLEGKRNWFKTFKQNNPKADIEFIGLALDASKSEIKIDNAYLAIDDYPRYLDEICASGKILFKGLKNGPYNRVPVNSNYYIVNTWDEISQMLEFDQFLSEEGIKIG